MHSGKYLGILKTGMCLFTQCSDNAYEVKAINKWELKMLVKIMTVGMRA